MTEDSNSILRGIENAAPFLTEEIPMTKAELHLRLKTYYEALERIVRYDLTRQRAGVNVAGLQMIAREALYGPGAAHSGPRDTRCPGGA
jgi:hypothetical protein